MWYYRIASLMIVMVLGLLAGPAASTGAHDAKSDRSRADLAAQEKGQRQKDDTGGQLRLNSTLIQVPTVVTDHNGKFVASLTKSNFTLLEDGKHQEIGTFAAVREPFNVVIVLDTSNSAEDRLKAMQLAAISFIKQIQPTDRAMVITFDNEIRQLTDFTSDREELEASIKNAEAGFGKLLYEAVDRALNELKAVEGRRAVILFTDGVDLESIEASSAGTMQLAEEIAATIYCVQFDTRWWIEAQARKQQAEEGNSPDSPIGADARIPLPGPGIGTGPGTGAPGNTGPHIEVETSGVPSITVHRENGRHGTITENLDQIYGKADAYLKGLSDRTGGRLFKAFDENDLQKAFAGIADELRNQYVLGYYPNGPSGDGKYHHIKVQVDKKDLEVRSRQGYRAEK
jgi:VWFA-related protein